MSETPPRTPPPADENPSAPAQPLHSTDLHQALAKRAAYFDSLEGEDLEKALAFQAQIDEVLAKAGPGANRMVLLQGLMEDHLKLLRENTRNLHENLKKILLDDEPGATSPPKKDAKKHLKLVKQTLN